MSYQLSCFVIQLCLILSSLAEPKIVFEPPELRKVVEGTTESVNWTLNAESSFPSSGVKFNVSYDIPQSQRTILEFIDGDNITDCVKPNTNFTYSFKVKAKFLGYTKVQLNLKGFDCDLKTPIQPESEYQYEYDVSVVRPLTIWPNVATITLGVVIAINYINVGCQLDLNEIFGVLKKPIGPIIGFCCQFLVMPMASFGFGYLLLEQSSLRLGLFVLGCSPGGSMSNFWTLIFKGDLNLSVTMTFISTIAALGMMPLWIFTLGQRLFHDGKADLPYSKLVISLVALITPLGIGILIRRFQPKWAKFSAKIIRPFTIIVILIALTVILYINRFIFSLFTWRIALAALCIVVTGYLLGACAAWLACLKKPQILTIAIETAFQNGGIAFLILTLSLPQPDADLTGVPIITQLLLTGLPMWLFLIIRRIRKCFKGDQSYSVYQEEVSIDEMKVDIQGKEAEVGSTKY